MKPKVALLLGDPAGIGPELAARVLADPAARAAAEPVLVADPEALEAGMRVAGVRPDLSGIRVVERRTGPGVRHAEATAASGQHILDTLEAALDLVRHGEADAVCFAPLNKTALHLAGMAGQDELQWLAKTLGHVGPVSELNVLDELWTSRVTSHVALRDVAGLLSERRILDAVGVLHRALVAAGKAAPRIAVCGLNPHAGEGGHFGREEIDLIGPAVERARAEGLPVEGPFPADTVFVRARAGAFDAVVTMYHDQGQIAMKLMGFERGVTVQGGLPVPVATPAHGTAFDIATREAGQGRAAPGAMLNAWAIAARMGASRRAQQQDAAA